MKDRRLTPAELLVTQEAVIAWIQTTRDAHRDSALPIVGEERELLAPFFGQDLLERMRVKEVDEIAIDLPNLPRTRKPIGFTFIDTVLLTERSPEILMHEGVHVEQYEILGLKKLAELYLRSSLSLFSYWINPFEQQAYRIQGDFTNNPGNPFNIPERVRREIGKMNL